MLIVTIFSNNWKSQNRKKCVKSIEFGSETWYNKYNIFLSIEATRGEK